MTHLKTPYAPVRTRRLRGVPNLSNRLRRDVGLPEEAQPLEINLMNLLIWRMIQ